MSTSIVALKKKQGEWMMINIDHTWVVLQNYLLFFSRISKNISPSKVWKMEDFQLKLGGSFMSFTILFLTKSFFVEKIFKRSFIKVFYFPLHLVVSILPYFPQQANCQYLVSVNIQIFEDLYFWSFHIYSWSVFIIVLQEI